jgi:hypothetical protein
MRACNSFHSLDVSAMNEMLPEKAALSPVARRLADEKPMLWEHRLFAQVLVDEVTLARPSRHIPSLVPRVNVPFESTDAWLGGRTRHIMALIQDLTRLINANHDDAFGPPGIPGNVENILVYARRMAAIYRQFIEWAHAVRDAEVDPRFKEVAYELSFLADSTLIAIEEFGREFLAKLAAACEHPKGRPINIDVHLELPVPDFTRFEAARSAAYAAIDSSYSTVWPPAAGYIYVLSNPSMGPYLKIGKTTRAPRERLAELSGSTGVPTPFVLEFDAYVEDVARAEQLVHTRLTQEGYRVAANREFFNVDVRRAVDVIVEVQRFVAVRRVE